jgi:hypothetical protein
MLDKIIAQKYADYIKVAKANAALVTPMSVTHVSRRTGDHFHDHVMEKDGQPIFIRTDELSEGGEWETMAFKGKKTGSRWEPDRDRVLLTRTYATREEAVAGHISVYRCFH